MGSSLSTGNLNYSESDDPWWALENDNYILDEPSLSEIHSFLQECGGSLKEKVKVINKNLYSKDQCASVNQTVAEKVAEEVSTVRDQTLDEFKEELRKKRMATQSAISDLRSELASLRQQLAEEREISRRLRCGETVPIEKKDAESSTTEIIVAEIQPDEGLSTSGRLGENSRDLKSQLAEAQLALQLANAENLSLTTELGVIRKQVSSLKEVIACSKQMIEVREVQVNQLKAKLQQIEDSLAERELRIMSDNLRQEYDRQLANIRNLRQLYEERARVCAAERENLLRQISIKKDELTTEAERVKNLEERIASLEDEVENSNKKIYELNLKCDEFKFENKSLKEEMEVVNKLFSQMLMGFNGTNNLDIDSLTTMLEENRSLLNEMATKEGTSDGASLPKLLFDIVRQAYTEDSGTQPAQEKAPCNELNVAKVATTQEIIGNLPKVWRVLMELLNHHKIERVQFQENGQSEDCYKSVQTPSGPKAELSVSKTYIKLKDLILEKKALQKETNKLKTLNTHLERRLNDQEKRLSTVSLELTKTWHLVGKMQRQHRQLHTNEQILRYQLQQKRRLLNELKDELEYCRRKWAAARAKNDESQLQCEDLRKEFAKRKLEDANNSAESGYSDGPASDEDDEQPVVKRAYSAAFTNSKKVERTSSASPTRTTSFETMPREKSAPPMTTLLTELTQIVDEIAGNAPLQNVACSSIVLEKPVATISQIPSRGGSSSKSGTVPKQGVRLSREKKLEKKKDPEEESLEEMFYRLSGTTAEVASSTDEEDNVEQDDRTQRIHRLEDQCKTLIAQVIETSENREKLEIQICRFQNEVPPAQRPQCLQDYMVSKYCASDAKQDPFPETSDLLNRATNTADKRDERLKLLEAESNQLMNRIKKTSDRSKRMKTRLEKIHSRCLSREGSAESMRSIGESSSFGQASGSNGVESAAICDTGNDKIGEESKPFTENSISSQTVQENNQLPREIIQITDVEGSCSESDHLALSSVSLTPSEQAGLIRRDDRLKRLEEEGKQLLSKLTSTNNRGSELSSRLDEIHEQASSRVTEEKPSESGQGSSENGASNAESETKTVLEKLEEVKQRLEKSKKLLSQLSSEPDPDINFTRRSVTNSRTQSESDSEGVVHGVRSRTTSSHDATESNLQKGDESSEDQSNNPEPQDGTGTQ